MPETDWALCRSTSTRGRIYARLWVPRRRMTMLMTEKKMRGPKRQATKGDEARGHELLLELNREASKLQMTLRAGS